LTSEFLNLMLDPFVDGRTGGFSSGGGAIGFAPEQEANLPPDIALAYASILNKAPPKPVFDQRWTAWGAAYGGSNSAGGNAAIGSNNITAQTFGFAAGMDYHATPDTILGFGLAGGGTNWGLASGLGTGRSDAMQAGVYGIHYAGPAYFAGALAFTNNWFTTSRSALGDQLTANFDGQSYGARLESGYRFGALPNLGVAPYAALQAQDFHTELQRGRRERRRLRTFLRSDECDRCANRAWQPFRRADAALWPAAHSTWPARLGTRLCQQPRAQCGL
jgi:Autotransporter beta-domain